MARRYLTSFIGVSTLVAGCALYSFPAMAADPPVDVKFAPPVEIKFSVEAFDKATVTTFEDKAVLTVLNGDVNFEVDSDQLTPRAREVLDGLAAEWTKAAPSKVTIVGHTDSVADDAYNLDLSLRRASSVGQYLSSKVSGLHISTDGKGESQPIADNNTEEGKAQNRAAKSAPRNNPDAPQRYWLSRSLGIVRASFHMTTLDVSEALDASGQGTGLQHARNQVPASVLIPRREGYR